jgi:hypothetical protein
LLLALKIAVAGPISYLVMIGVANNIRWYSL